MPGAMLLRILWKASRTIPVAAHSAPSGNPCFGSLRTYGDKQASSYVAIPAQKDRPPHGCTELQFDTSAQAQASNSLRIQHDGSTGRR